MCLHECGRPQPSQMKCTLWSNGALISNFLGQLSVVSCKSHAQWPHHFAQTLMTPILSLAMIIPNKHLWKFVSDYTNLVPVLYPTIKMLDTSLQSPFFSFLYIARMPHLKSQDGGCGLLSVPGEGRYKIAYSLWLGSGKRSQAESFRDQEIDPGRREEDGGRKGQTRSGWL